MRSLRLTAAMLALALVAAACGDDENGEGDPVNEVTTTTGSASPTTTQPRVTTPTTAPPTTTTTVVVVQTTSTTAPPETAVSIGPPSPPSNVRCQAGTAENELLVAFDALANPADVSKIRVYVSVDGGPMITNGEYTVGEIDSSGDRWAAPARRVPANVPLRLTATSFNQLGQESGWYIVEGQYSGPGAPCGEPLPPPTGTAGFGEGEGEQGT